jgi:endo-alpha-1,4-polygalactosaminidase (GH114 family)
MLASSQAKLVGASSGKKSVKAHLKKVKEGHRKVFKLDYHEVCSTTTKERKLSNVFDFTDEDLVLPSKAERKEKGIELAEEKISKQALLEALFNTQYWSQPYI